MSMETQNENILAAVEAAGGGYVWDAEVFAVTLIDVLPDEELVHSLCGLTGVQQIAIDASMRIRHGSGVFGKWLVQLAKTDVLVLDDWGMGAIDNATRSDLLEIIDDRAANRATIITSQLPIEHWHAWIGDATIADAILDRVMQRNHRLTLTGDSLRQSKPKKIKEEASTENTK